MPNCKPREELHNGKCRVKCLPNQVRSSRSGRCIDETRFTRQTEQIEDDERQRQADRDRARVSGFVDGRAVGMADGQVARDNLEASLLRRNANIAELTSINQQVTRESRLRMEMVGRIGQELEAKRMEVNSLIDEGRGKDVTIQDLKNQRRELRSYSRQLQVESEQLKEEFRKSRSARVRLTIETILQKNQIRSLEIEIEKKIQQNAAMIIGNAVRKNLNETQKAELRDRIRVVAEEKESIEHQLQQTSDELNDEIKRLKEINTQQQDRISSLMLDRERSRLLIVQIDIEVNRQREEQNVLIQRQLVNNEALVNAQNELRDSRQGNSELTMRLEALSVDATNESLRLQSEINILSISNRENIEERERINLQLNEQSVKIRNLRLEREQQADDTSNTEQEMEQRLEELKDENDLRTQRITSLEYKLNEKIARLELLSEENQVMAAQLRVSENTILDFRRRLFDPTE